jgi:hypothetical protein
MRRLWWGAALSALAAAMVTAGPAAASTARSVAATSPHPTSVPADQADDVDLAQRFAPVVRLVRQDEACGPGEPFQPSDVDAFLDNDTVALRGPWTTDDLISTGPSGADLGRGLPGYHLDFPGDPLNPGCDYEEWARQVVEGTEPTVYSHVATDDAHPDRLALQYWLYYPFNDYNNKHEGDWEMIQLEFDAPDAATAIGQDPVLVGYSQHEGVEQAVWGDAKLGVVDGTHPVVHVAAGSHANYFGQALYLGRSGQQGFGCDDTRTPTVDLTPEVQVIPQDPAAADAAYPWIAFEGHWGQRESAFYNGPTGPSQKDQWTAPVTWSEDEGRDQAYAVPAGGLLGTNATDLFCEGVAGGSDLLRLLTANPGPALLVLLIVVVLITWIVRRTEWTPSAPLHLARRRAAGQIVTAAIRMYAAHPLLFISIGLITLPASLLVGLAQTVTTLLTGSAASSEDASTQSLWVSAVTLVGALVTTAATLLVQSATIRAMVEIDAGREVGVRRAYVLGVDRWFTVLRTFLLITAAAFLLAVTIVLAPLALVLVVLAALYIPVIQLEGLGPVQAVRRSAALVRHHVVKVAVLIAGALFAVAAVGPVVGMLLIVLGNVPFTLANLISGLVYAVLAPIVAINTTYVYENAVVHDRLADRLPRRDVLPAELPGRGVGAEG